MPGSSSRIVAFLILFLVSCDTPSGPGEETGGNDPGPSGPASPPVASVLLAPANVSLSVGDTSRLTATAVDANGAVLSGKTVAWSSQNSTIATVSSSGLVTGVAAGNVSISATIDGKSASASVAVVLVAASVSVSPPTLSLIVGDTARLSARVLDLTGAVIEGKPVAWISQTPSVATVSSSGLVTAIGSGNGSIEATVDGKSAAATLSVAEAVLSIRLSQDTATLPAGWTIQLTAMALDSNGHSLDRTITWATNNAAVATVSPTGLVSAVGGGAAKITASSEMKSASAEVTSLRLEFRRIELGSHGGSSGSCGLTDDGKMFCWGALLFGDDVDRRQTAVPIRAAPGLTFTSLSMNAGTVCGAGPVAYCWGANNHAAVGNGSATVSDVLTPYRVGVFSEISTSSEHTCGLTSAGALSCWGENYVGQVGIGRRFGGPITTPTLVPNFSATSIDPLTSLARTYARPFTSVSAGVEFTCALSRDSVASEVYPQPVPPAGTVPAKMVAASKRSCWGHNFSGELGVGYFSDSLWLTSPTEPANDGLLWKSISVSAGNRFACGIGGAREYQIINSIGYFGSVPSQLWCWGYNSDGQLGIGLTGYIQSSDLRFGTPLRVALENAEEVSAGSDHACAIASGRAYCWGSGSKGQLGNGSQSSSSSPVLVSGGLTFRQLSAGTTYTCGITTQNVTYCWGENSVGQLGNGTLTNSTVPVRVLGNP